jgi:hypothetical protein
MFDENAEFILTLVILGAAIIFGTLIGNIAIVLRGAG